MTKTTLALLVTLLSFSFTSRVAWGGDSAASSDLNSGPYNLTSLAGGVGLERPLGADAGIVGRSTQWTFSGWVRLDADSSGPVIVAAVGDPIDSADGSGWRGFLIDERELEFRLSGNQLLRSGLHLATDQWHALLATYDGSTARLFVDGQERSTLRATTVEVAPVLSIAPVNGGAENGVARHFGGSLAGLRVESRSLDASEAAHRATLRPDFGLIRFETIGAGWPWQEHAWRGLQVPQDPWTEPTSHAVLPRSVASAVVESPALTTVTPSSWRIGGWRLQASPQVVAKGELISQASFDAASWYPAIVPGTVLTTLVARGVYPDPDFGLNNLAIPESLNEQDYWYRTAFVAPARSEGQRFSIDFKGINYAASVWINGHAVGSIQGAFIRGIFDVTDQLVPGRSNAIAVKVSPAPHPGIAHEQSILAGPGNNGGAMAIDGPTFFATEGWDWIPGIRDRDTGLWQAIELSRLGSLTIADPHVVTQLSLPDTDHANIFITVPVHNSSAMPLNAAVEASFDGILARKVVNLAPGTTAVTFTPDEDATLRVSHPTLWWPNGYGDPALHTLRIEVKEGGVVSDSTSLRFGIRELTYELSLFDHAGRLRRVEIDPSLAARSGESLVDIRHEAIKRTPNGWAASLTPAAERSSAVRPVDTESLSPYLVIRVNGVPIAARGGNWGMDDSRKRISREHLEPYFKLTRDAHLDIIRNWAGQNTEDVFYDLADEYGLLVLNDFWASTQDFQVEPQDPAVFLANARDVISRYRNHPSIAVWFGRNEGVPQPIINEGLNALVAALDGTRYYTGSSNSINLQGSGPYNYQKPEGYFTNLASGFSVEVGTPSLSTLESLRASIAPADLWPLSDAYAYHDWHFGGNGDVASFMAEMSEEFGEATGLEDFERKSQMLDYVSYRAIFEGFQAHLWTKNSGRLLWMTHPAWPSNTWQIYSSDYDTAAAYYAVKKACEPLHAQLNLPDFTLAVTNITRSTERQLTLRTRIVSLDNTLLDERVDRIDAMADSVTTITPALDLQTVLEHEKVVLVRLTLMGAQGQVLSNNTYWQGQNSASLRRLNTLNSQPIAVTARSRLLGDAQELAVDLHNGGSQAVLNLKVTALNGAHTRILPVSYSDNYLALLPGETRHITIQCPRTSGVCTRLAVRGWNVQPREIAIGAGLGG